MIYALGHLTPLVVGIALLIQPASRAAIGWVVYDERLAAARSQSAQCSSRWRWYWSAGQQACACARRQGA